MRGFGQSCLLAVTGFRRVGTRSHWFPKGFISIARITRQNSANDAPGFWIDELRANPTGLYVDLGCGLRNVLFDNCLYIDVYPSVSADIVISPNTKLPLKDESC